MARRPNMLRSEKIAFDYYLRIMMASAQSANNKQTELMGVKESERRDCTHCQKTAWCMGKEPKIWKHIWNTPTSPIARARFMRGNPSSQRRKRSLLRERVCMIAGDKWGDGHTAVRKKDCIQQSDTTTTTPTSSNHQSRLPVRHDLHTPTPFNNHTL